MFAYKHNVDARIRIAIIVLLTVVIIAAVYILAPHPTVSETNIESPTDINTTEVQP